MKNIFKWFTLVDNSLSSIRVSWFAKRFDYEEFEGIDKVLSLFLNYCADLNIPAHKKYLESFLQTECKKLIKRYKIRLATMEKFNYNEPASLEEAFRVIASSVLAQYDEYIKIDLHERDFKVDMKTFMSEQKTMRTQRVMAEAFPMFSAGGDADEIINNLQYNLDRITILYDEAYLDKLDFMTGNSSTAKSTDVMNFLFKTNIPCVDGDVGGVFSKQVWSFAAAPGAGKTRWSMAHFAYPAAVVSKIDVVVDSLELTKGEVENMLIAFHIINLYGGKVKIPDSAMNKNKLTDEQRRYYEAAKIDLFESGKYGKIIIRTDDLIVERFEKEAYTYLKHNSNTRLWIIDYAGLAKSKPSEKFSKFMEEHQIIQELYKTAKGIAKLADIAFLIINQFSEKGVEASYAGKKIRPGHVQGGQIIQRHSDYDLAMCMTEEQEIANMRTLSTVKKRAAAGFQNVPFSTDLSVSIFRQIKQDALN